LWRSRKVAWLAALLAFALIAAACGGDDDTGGETTTTAAAVETTTTAATQETTTTAAPTTTAAEAGKPYGGEAIAADDQEPPTLNRFVPGGDNAIVSIIGQAYWTGVYEIDGFTLELIPDLVTELPTVANGGAVVNDDGTMTVTYPILDEAQWSDGTPISGDDFQFTLDTILNPDLPVDKATYDQIVSTEVGPKTFTYVLAAPTPLFELIFDNIIPKHAVEGSDFLADWNDAMWPSSGPFVFDTWQKGEFLTVVRNDNYWKTDPKTGQQLPYLDSVTWRFIPETESIITAFRGREVDIIQPPPATESIEQLQALEPEGAVVEVLSGPVWEHLNFQFGPNNRNENTANANLNYRKCVAHLIDKQLIVDEILAGQVEPLDSFVEAFTPALSQGSWAQYDYNVEGAQAFCDAAKADLGVDTLETNFSTTSNNDARVKLSELFVDMFGAVGIDYTNDLEDSQLFFGETLDNGTFDLGEWAWVGSPGLAGLVSIMDVWDPENPCPEGSNCYQYGTEGSTLVDENSQRFAEIRDELNSSVDEAVLVPLINEAESLLADQVVLVPLYARLVVAAWWGDELAGVKHNPTQAGYTWNIEFWYRVDL
jgi:peptide/nickel transport system substrate-binding protein